MSKIVADLYTRQISTKNHSNYRIFLLDVHFPPWKRPQQQYWLSKTRSLLVKIQERKTSQQFLSTFYAAFDQYVNLRDVREEYLFLDELLFSIFEMIRDEMRDKLIPQCYCAFAEELEKSGFMGIGNHHSL